MAKSVNSRDPIKFSNEACPSINRKYLEGDREFVLSVKMTNSFLKYLRNVKEKNDHLSHIDIVNNHLKHIRIKQSPRVETRLQCQCASVIKQYRTKYKGGRKRYAYDKIMYRLALYESELCEFNESVTAEASISTLDNEVAEREASCEEIWCYISEDQMVHFQSPDFDSLNRRQQRRRLDKITERSMKALEFLDEYGLTPTILKLSSDGQKEHCVNYYPPCGFSDLSEVSKNRLRSVVSILDRFGVSENAYHELSQIFPDLPRTHSVVKERCNMTSTLNIQRVPNGAMVSFNEELQKTIGQIYKGDSDVNNVTVLLSADGTRVSRIATFVIVSFQLIGANTEKLSSNLCTLAIANCKEDYANLKISFNQLFEEINTVIDDGGMYIGGKKVNVQIVFCADMKMILTVMGLGSATSTYSCPWCLVRREDRCITSHPWDYYNRDDMKRSIETNKQHADDKTYGVQHYPLLNINIDDYIIDELHLLLRITDVLLKALIEDSCRLSGQEGKLSLLVKCINSCGVQFQVWEDRDTKKLNWTSLPGQEKKKLLLKLPQQLKGKLDVDKEEATLKLWTLFRQIYEDISSSTPTSADNIFGNSKLWLNTFLSVYPSLKDKITPYIHCMVYHIPLMIEKFGTIKPFSCQVVEKTNDDIKKIYQRKSHKWDPAMEVLTIRKRMEENSDLTRVKRKYTKRNEDYWNEELKVNRQNKRAKIRADTESLQTDSSINAEQMSSAELRDVLKIRSITTKVKSREKLLEMVDRSEK